ncbi:Secreted protein (fragment) [Capnocytophaga canimorsus]
MLLTNSFKGFQIELKPGFNKVEFLALNQGESGPNTAEFSVLDENGNTISSAQWNLATGAKAHFVIVKNE